MSENKEKQVNEQNQSLNDKNNKLYNEDSVVEVNSKNIEYINPIVNGETLSTTQYNEREISKNLEQEIDTKTGKNILSRSDLRWSLANERVESGYYAISAGAAHHAISSASQEETGSFQQARTLYSFSSTIVRTPLAVSDLSNKAQLVYRPIKNATDYFKGEELTYQTKKVLTYADIRKIAEKDPSIRVLLVGGDQTKVNLKFDVAIDNLQKTINSGKLTGEALKEAQERLSKLKQIKSVRNGGIGRRNFNSLLTNLISDQLSKSTEPGIAGLSTGFNTVRTVTSLSTRYAIPAAISLTRATSGMAYRGVKRVTEKPVTLVLDKGKKEVKKVIAKHPSLRRQQLRAQKTVKTTKKIISKTKSAVNGGIYSSVKSRFELTKAGKMATALKNYYGKFVANPFNRFIGRPFRHFVVRPYNFAKRFVVKPFNATKMLFRKTGLVLVKVGAGAAVFLICNVLIIQLMQTVASTATSIVHGDETESGKINLSKFAKVLDKKDEKFTQELEAIVDKYDYVTFVDGFSTDNFREIVSMSAVYFEQDFDNWDNVKSYLNEMYDLSHSYQVKELPDTYCDGCKERSYSCAEKGHKIDNSKMGGCLKKTIPDSDSIRLDKEAEKGDTTYYKGEIYTYNGTNWVHYYCYGTHKEKFCPGHSNARITLDTKHFDELFEIDPNGNTVAVPGVAGEKIGNFTITYYCTEKYSHMCNDAPEGALDDGLTATGTIVTPGRSIAVDPSVIPLGSKVVINGFEYVAEDVGGMINNMHIDIAVSTHEEALAKGRETNVPVYWAINDKELSEDEKENIENNTWEGWTEDNREIAENIYNQNWNELYEGWETLVSTEYIPVDWEQIELVDGKLTDKQKKIVEVATNSGKYGIKAPAGWCQAWVADVYAEVTGQRASKGSALKAANAWAVSNDWSKLPVGATVYGHPTYSESGIKYGHVGIYIGNGKVAHNIGGVDIDSIEKWVSYYRGFAWGWNGNQDLTK